MNQRAPLIAVGLVVFIVSQQAQATWPLRRAKCTQARVHNPKHAATSSVSTASPATMTVAQFVAPMQQMPHTVVVQPLAPHLATPALPLSAPIMPPAALQPTATMQAWPTTATLALHNVAYNAEVWINGNKTKTKTDTEHSRYYTLVDLPPQEASQYKVTVVTPRCRTLLRRLTVPPFGAGRTYDLRFSDADYGRQPETKPDNTLVMPKPTRLAAAKIAPLKSGEAFTHNAGNPLGINAKVKYGDDSAIEKFVFSSVSTPKDLVITNTGTPASQKARLTVRFSYEISLKAGMTVHSTFHSDAEFYALFDSGVVRVPFFASKSSAKNLSSQLVAELQKRIDENDSITQVDVTLLAIGRYGKEIPVNMSTPQTATLEIKLTKMK